MNHPPRKSVSLICRSVFAALCALALFFSVLYPCSYVLRAQTKALPFTITNELWDYSHMAGGELVSRSTKARRSDGTTANISYSSTGERSNPRVRDIALPDGRSSEVFDLIQAVVDWPAPADHLAAAKFRLEPPDCVNEGWYVAGHGSLLGEKVVMLAQVPRGSAGTTMVRAPRVDCESLEYLTTRVQSDGAFKLLSRNKLVSLKIGEPDLALFRVPANYKSLTPSQAQKEMAEKLGFAWTAEDAKRAAEQDAAYYQRRGSSAK